LGSIALERDHVAELVSEEYVRTESVLYWVYLALNSLLVSLRATSV